MNTGYMEVPPIVSFDFHQIRILRSKLVDSFALAERSLCAVAVGLGLQFKNELIGQRIERTLAVPAGPQYSKERRARIHASLDEFSRLLPIRNFVVHSHLQEIRLDDGSCYACFKSLRNIAPPESDILTMSSLQLELIDDQALKIASDLRIA
ncbi:MAG: hypothetical protein ABL926_10755 [Novosphingobium sp.]|uniref:hypothetical protein n=1 Tax=Novosphingobium sp. TaxID=1874826 RepID=UPI0032B87973